MGTLLVTSIRLLATMADAGEVNRAAIYVQNNVIQFAGKMEQLPDDMQKADVELDGSDLIIIPGKGCSARCMSVQSYKYGPARVKRCTSG